MPFPRPPFTKRSSASESTRQQQQQQQQSASMNQNIETDSSKNDSAFECNICLETAKDAVVSMCGHLFCWPCLYQWMYATDNNTQSHKTCPVCKSAISREKTIPIYGRGGDTNNQQDPRDKLPPRPAGQRTEVPNQQNQFPYNNVWAMGGPGAHIFNFGDGAFHLSLGITSLPQYLLAFLHEYTTDNERRNDADYFWSRVFAICGILCIVLTLYFV